MYVVWRVVRPFMQDPPSSWGEGSAEPVRGINPVRQYPSVGAEDAPVVDRAGLRHVV